MDRIEQLTAELIQFDRDRDWDRFHDPKNLVMSLAAEAGELVAEYRWIPSAESDHLADPGSAARDRVTDEIGDVIITVLLLCARIGADPVECATAKMRKNAVKYPPQMR